MDVIVKIVNAITVILCAYCSTATASVVLSGTRIIYPEKNAAYSVHLSNKDDANYLIQTEITDAKQEKNSDFIITPQYFKIAPYAGQVMRIRYAGRELPQDRETLFYFTFTQIPSIKKNNNRNAEMIFAVSNKVKLIYRPDQMKGGIDLEGRITLQKQDGKWVVFNRSPYIASIKKVAVTCQSSSHVILENATIEPFTSLNAEKEPGPCGPGADFSYVYLNDYGVDITVKDSL